ncbi:MAG: hypothetical protein DHS20C11_18430 [Lysobacteraceae bacterium]|nr:MAG: hypothetical protein DHS20C11_18430 [Xanthomonadaceae bacterium]
MIPGYEVHIEVAGVEPCADPPQAPISRFVEVTADGITLGGLSSSENPSQACVPSGFTPWTYQINELNVPLSSGLRSGPTTLFLEQHYGLEPPSETDITIQLPNATTQFLYLSSPGGVHVLRTDNLQLEKFLPTRPVNHETGRIEMDDASQPLVFHDYAGPYPGNYFLKLEPELSQYTDSEPVFSPGTDLLDVGGSGYLYYSDPSTAHSLGNGWLLVSYEGEEYDLGPTSPPQQLAPAGGLVFVSMPEENILWVIDGLSVINSVAVGSEPKAIHQSRSRDQVVVSNAGDGTVSLVDPYSLEVTTSLPFGAEILQFTHARTAGRYYGAGDNGLLYSIHQVSAEIEVLAFNRPVVGVASNWENNHLYVLINDDVVSELVVLEAGTGQEIDRQLLSFPAMTIGSYSSESFYTVRPEGLDPVPIPVTTITSNVLLAMLILAVAFQLRRLRQN